MAFVAFGRKKVNNIQQQQILNTIDSEATKDASGSSLQSGQDAISQEDLDRYGIAEERMEVEQRKIYGVSASLESQTDSQRELLEEEEGGGIPKLLEHNVALRRNFDNLKKLHLQLTDANTQLQEAFLKLQTEKKKMESGHLHYETIQHEKELIVAELEDMRVRHAKELTGLKSEREEASVLAIELEQKNRSLETKLAIMKAENKDVNHKLEVVRYGHQIEGSESDQSCSQLVRMEKDQALMGKHNVELEYARELSLVKVEDQSFRQQAADLAHKCKHLEIDLEKAISAGEVVHRQLVALTFEKDSTIIELEQALRRLKDDMQALEKKRKDNESEWHVERLKFQAIIEGKEREEHLLKSTIKGEADQKLRESLNEIVELRIMVNSLEKSSATAELQHLEAMKDLKKERDKLQKELGASWASQKEAENRLIEMEKIRDQLGDSLAQNHKLVHQIAECRKTNDEHDKKMEIMKAELAGQMSKLEEAQRRWAEEKCAILKREDKLVQEGKKDYCSKNRSLKKKLKQTYKVLNAMTTNHNQLLVRMREYEAQLAIAQTVRFQTAVDSNVPVGESVLKFGRFEVEMKHLGDRQARYLPY